MGSSTFNWIKSIECLYFWKASVDSSGRNLSHRLLLCLSASMCFPLVLGLVCCLTRDHPPPPPPVPPRSYTSCKSQLSILQMCHINSSVYMCVMSYLSIYRLVNLSIYLCVCVCVLLFICLVFNYYYFFLVAARVKPKKEVSTSVSCAFWFV